MPDLLTDLSRELSGLSARLAPHLVAVQSGHRTFSGFVWREGLVVTSDEALEAEEGIGVTLADGTRLPATLAGRDPSTDIVLLRVDDPAGPPAPLDALSPTLGELALALGRGAEGPVAALGIVGVVGPAWRSLRDGRIDALVRLDLRLPDAAEGGLAVDAAGRPFGMAVYGPRGSTLVIPTATIERVAAHLVQHGRIGRGYLGLGLQPVRVEGSGDHGILVSSVDEAGPGRQAGLLQGDIITGLNGEPVGGMRTLMARLGPESVGQAVEFGVLRGGTPTLVTLVIGERPAA